MRTWIAGAALLLAGCASTQMKRYVGQDISEVRLRYGSPSQVVALPDGRQAYQFQMPDVQMIVPGNSQTTVTGMGNVAQINSTGSPARVHNLPGCVITFIADQAGRVVETRAPSLC